MDDILFAQQQEFTDEQITIIQATLAKHALVVAPEKMQQTTPWKYLGWTITAQRIRPQKLLLNIHITNLHQAQKLLGDLQ